MKSNAVRTCSLYTPIENTSINSICEVNLLNYLKNAESMQDRLKATNAIIAGCANGDIVFVPMPVPKDTLELLYWDRKGRQILMKDCTLQEYLQTLNIAVTNQVHVYTCIYSF